MIFFLKKISLFCFFFTLATHHLFAEKISVVGTGRLGLCLALCLEKAGHHIMGVDLAPEYVDQINFKTLNSPEPNVNQLLKESQNFKATTSLNEALDFGDIIFITVSTTYGTEAYNFSMLNDLLAEINALKLSNKHLVISSTVFPGYIEKTARQLLRDCHNVTLNYCPPFIAQGEIVKGLLFPDMVLIGEENLEAGQVLRKIYQSMCKETSNFEHMSVESVEIAKFAVNCFITAKISYANLVADIADETLGADKIAILRAVGKDSRIGSKCLLPGYGFGGPCFPRDNRGLGAYAEMIGIDPVIFKATDVANANHAQYMANKLMQQNLLEYVFEDVSYKPNSPVAIIDESQKLVVAQKIAEQGGIVTIVDRECVITQVQKKFGGLFNYKIID